MVMIVSVAINPIVNHNSSVIVLPPFYKVFPNRAYYGLAYAKSPKRTLLGYFSARFYCPTWVYPNGTHY